MLNRTELKLPPNESKILFLLVIINLKLVYYPVLDIGLLREFQNLICPPSLVMFDHHNTHAAYYGRPISQSSAPTLSH